MSTPEDDEESDNDGYTDDDDAPTSPCQYLVHPKGRKLLRFPQVSNLRRGFIRSIFDKQKGFHPYVSKIFLKKCLTHVFDVVAVPASIPVSCLSILVTNILILFHIDIVSHWYCFTLIPKFTWWWYVFLLLFTSTLLNWCIYRVEPCVWGRHETISSTNLKKCICGFYFFSTISIIRMYLGVRHQNRLVCVNGPSCGQNGFRH